jgi:hypothetical protein
MAMAMVMVTVTVTVMAVAMVAVTVTAVVKALGWVVARGLELGQEPAYHRKRGVGQSIAW